MNYVTMHVLKIIIYPNQLKPPPIVNQHVQSYMHFMYLISRCQYNGKLPIVIARDECMSKFIKAHGK